MTLLLSAAGIATAIVVWAAVSASGLVSAQTLPPPAVVGGRAVTLVFDAEFQRQYADTLTTWILALSITGLVAVPVGLLIGYFAFLRRPTELVIHGLRSIPSTALLPVAILFFGLGLQMKFAMVAYAIAWPLLLNTVYGVRSVDPTAMYVARSLRWSTPRSLVNVVLPSAAPSIATGFRIAGGIALVVVLSAELLGASRGIGTELVRYQQSDRPDFVYAGIVLVGLTGIALQYGLARLERHLIPWAPAAR